MDRIAIKTFEELIVFAGNFVEKQKGIWDHSTWLEFLSDIQKRGFLLSLELQKNLGAVLESMKKLYESISGIQYIKNSLQDISKDTTGFIEKNKGLWDHTSWEAYLKAVQKRGFNLTDEMMSYLGSTLETTRAFYTFSPMISRATYSKD